MTFNIQSRLPSAQFNLESIPDADRLNIARSALLELYNKSDRCTWLKAYLTNQALT
jgi:hypothetical protein